MKKVSIIIPCYGTEIFVEKCINSVFNQSYKNIEIIAVNDCSPGNMGEILEKLKAQDDRLKVITNKENKGLFHTRIIGSKEATGDFITFLDSDDFIDIDYIRLLVEKADTEKCDVVIGNYVRKNKNKEYITSLSYFTNDKVYDGEDFYKLFYKQSGRNIRFHLIWNKLIKIDIWKELLKEVTSIKDRIVMTEDFAFTSVVLYYAKKVAFCDRAIYYYSINDNQSTSVKNISVDKINKNISDILKVFSFTKSFLISKNVFEKYKEDFEIWEAFYLTIHINIYKRLKSKKKNIEKLSFDYENNDLIKRFSEIQKTDKSWDNYHGLATPYNDGLTKIKEMIMDENIEIVSFDMFDTLVSRPFFLPSDMFLLLNKTFLETFDTMKAIDFSRIRKKCEAEIRDINYLKGISEVTLDEIYDHISELYNLDKKKLDKIKQKEIELELHFCRKRNSGYELYSFAKSIGKKVILASDIYLSKDVLLKILEKNGYSFDEYYVSSELLKTKANGSMFEYIKEKEKTDKIIHIGDNYHSDFKKPQEHGLKSAQLLKAIDVMMGYTPQNVRHCGDLYKHFVLFNQDHIPYEENYGVRCSLAIVANYYFDNPFTTFNSYSEFNGDPYFIGYYALGMQLIAICKWLMNDAKENKIDSIAFMARDGYIPYKSAQIYNKYIKPEKNIALNYTYVSRKSLMPLLLKDKSGLSLIETYLNFDMITPNDIMEQLSSVLTCKKESLKAVKKEYNLDEKFKTLKDFNNCLSLIYDKCFDKEKYKEYYKMCKKYFDEQFSGNTSTFDIGYSGKPEAIISSVIEKPITTYFIHTNNSQGFNNIHNCNSKLKTFYEYKPTLTGTIRELFISHIGPSCIGYEYKNKEVKPIFSTSEKYNFFNIDMISKIQEGALSFVEDFCDYFGEYIDEIDLNKYYMSIPLEYYYHYTQLEDRIPTKDLLFEDNVNNYVELNTFIFNRYKAYSSEYSMGIVPKLIEGDVIDYTLPKYRLGRLIHYALYDKKELRHKWKKWSNKKHNPKELPNSRFKRIIYYTIFDRETLKNKILRR